MWRRRWPARLLTPMLECSKKPAAPEARACLPHKSSCIAALLLGTTPPLHFAAALQLPAPPFRVVVRLAPRAAPWRPMSPQKGQSVTRRVVEPGICGSKSKSRALAPRRVSNWKVTWARCHFCKLATADWEAEVHWDTAVCAIQVPGTNRGQHRPRAEVFAPAGLRSSFPSTKMPQHGLAGDGRAAGWAVTWGACGDRSGGVRGRAKRRTGDKRGAVDEERSAGL